MVITTSVETLDVSWIYCYTCCILGRALRIKETLLDFCENMDPKKWDTIVWYQVTRNPQEFRGLTGYQRDPRVLERHNFTSKTQTSSRFPNDSPRKTFSPSQDLRKREGNIQVNKVDILATWYTYFPKQNRAPGQVHVRVS